MLATLLPSISAAILVAALGLLHSAVSLFVGQNFEPPWIGFVLSAPFAGYAATVAWGHHFIGRWGYVGTYLGATLVAIGVTLLLTTTEIPLVWVLCRAATGASTVLTFVVVESWLNASAATENRGRVMAAYIFMNQIGFASGNALVSFTGTTGLTPYLCGAALMFIAAIPISQARGGVPEKIPHARIRFLDLLKQAPFGLTGIIVSGLFNGCWITLGPLLAKARLQSLDSVATFMTSFALSGLLLQWPLGRLADRIDRRYVLGGACVALGLGAAVMLVMPVSLPTMVASAVAIGAFGFTLYPLGAAQVQDRVRPDQRVSAAGAVLLVYSVGASAGPFIASLLLPAFGTDSVLYVTIAAAASMALPFLLVGTKRDPRATQGAD